MASLQKIKDQLKLKHLCDQVLKEETPIVLLENLRELHKLLLQIGNIGEHDSSSKIDLILPSGKAIAPIWAAMCITDFFRTQRFFRGILQAVMDLQNKYPGEKIQILYAGTGPFATLALPIMCLFSADEVAFTLIEIQETSVDSLHKIVAYFDLQDYVQEIIQADATIYKLEKSNQIHLVISETMQHALEKEPQVEITLNLTQQVNEETIWIPQNIKIDVGLMNMKKDTERQMGLLPDSEASYIDIGTLLHLDKETFKKNDEQIPLLYKAQHTLPTAFIESYPWLVLMTTIHIYGDQYLMPWGSILCAPRLLTDLSQHSKNTTIVEFWYTTGSSPGFEYKLLD